MSIVLILFLILLGIGGLYYTQNLRKENSLIESWPKTPGKMLKTHEFDYPYAHQVYLGVEYEFFVNGVRYQSNKVHRLVTKEKTETIQKDWNNRMYVLRKPYDLDKIEFLKNPEVRYNPQDPTDCCLILKPGRILFLIISILMLVIGVFGLLLKMI